MSFTHIMDVVSRVFAAVGVAVLIIGFLFALVTAGIALLQKRGDVYRAIRRQFGRSILLGLEIWSLPISSAPWPWSPLGETCSFWAGLC